MNAETGLNEKLKTEITALAPKRWWKSAPLYQAPRQGIWRAPARNGKVTCWKDYTAPTGLVSPACKGPARDTDPRYRILYHFGRFATINWTSKAWRWGYS